MARLSISQQLSDSRLMVEGLKKRADEVSKVGITEAKSTEISDLTEKLEKLNSEQEQLKAQLKTKTAELEDTQKQLETLMSSTKKLIKIAVDKNDWLTFGISDKK